MAKSSESSPFYPRPASRHLRRTQNEVDAQWKLVLMTRQNRQAVRVEARHLSSMDIRARASSFRLRQHRESEGTYLVWLDEEKCDANQ